MIIFTSGENLNLRTKVCLSVSLLSLLLGGCSTELNSPSQHETPIARSEVRKRDFGNVMGDDFLLFGGPAKPGQAQPGYSSAVNPYLWKASLDTLSFVPLASADAVGGVIVTEWHTAENRSNERMKMTIVISDRALRADALQVIIHKQRLSGGCWVAQSTDESAQSRMEEIILTKARELRVAKLEAN
jgi:Domain of unknown function (DUF3576)